MAKQWVKIIKYMYAITIIKHAYYYYVLLSWKWYESIIELQYCTHTGHYQINKVIYYTTQFRHSKSVYNSQKLNIVFLCAYNNNVTPVCSFCFLFFINNYFDMFKTKILFLQAIYRTFFSISEDFCVFFPDICNWDY